MSLVSSTCCSSFYPDRQMCLEIVPAYIRGADIVKQPNVDLLAVYDGGNLRSPWPSSLRRFHERDMRICQQETGSRLVEAEATISGAGEPWAPNPAKRSIEEIRSAR
jgi:hypothetical protein